ncbi:MAG: nucleotidyltransferase family protein [Tepidisphaeraceae bacterium]
MRIGPVQIPDARIADFCRRHGVVRLSVFGSALNGTLRPDSDIDILVEFPPGKTPSLFDLGGMRMELTAALGREVDLKTPGFLSPRILEIVRRVAEAKYAA